MDTDGEMLHLDEIMMTREALAKVQSDRVADLTQGESHFAAYQPGGEGYQRHLDQGNSERTQVCLVFGLACLWA
jgi:hypothetical protein